MTIKCATPESYDLLHQGVLALSQLEMNGIRIDLEFLNKAIRKAEKKIPKLEAELMDTKVFKRWQKTFGQKTKLGSPQQLATLFFNVYKYPCRLKTENTNLPSAKEENFQDIDHPFVKKYFEWKGVIKMKNTYLRNILRETDSDGFLHASYNLHTTDTLRGSVNDPSFQNMPIRDPEMGKWIRGSFIPRKNCDIAEVDYGQLEWKCASAFWKDPGMVAYASDPTKDIHRDKAMDCYMCSEDQVSKNMRYCAKNMIVFPLLYGSYHKNCATHLWEAVNRMDLCLADGTPLGKHLKKKGIKELGRCEHGMKPELHTFEVHIKGVEDRFNAQFPGFGKGKERWWNQYLERGWFPLMTGFVIQGIYSRNFLLNCPIQGPGFHLLLWSLIRIQKLLTKRKMRTLLIGSIHDCILADVWKGEMQDFLNLCKQVMTVDVRKHWDWVIVPLIIEADVVEEGSNWHLKKPLIEKDGMWKLKAA